MNHRARGLLDLAHVVFECKNCGKHTEGCEPAHENAITAGKGQSVKSHDHRHAALCHECHAWYDQGRGMDPSELYHGDRQGKRDMWIRAHLLTYDYYWLMGWLVVKPPPP